MSRVKIEQGYRYFCQTIESNEPLYGTFAIDGADIRSYLVRFDKYLEAEAPNPLIIRTEANWYASMYDTIPIGWQHRMGMGDGAYIQETASNITLVGADIWAPDDLVQRVTFRINQLEEVLTNSPVYSDIIHADILDIPDPTIFELSTGDWRVKAQFVASGNMLQRHPSGATPWFTIEFNIGQSINSTRSAVNNILRFFSTLAGKKLKASDLHVCRYSEIDRRNRISCHDPIPEHSVYTYDGGQEETLGSVATYDSLILVRNENERISLENCLKKWIQRDSDWKNASTIMMETLAHQGTVDAARLLSATRCLEEIPNANPRDVISPTHAKALGKLVGRGAEQLGYRSVAGRFKSAISMIALESNRDRISRLVSDVRASFGANIVDDHIGDWVLKAWSLRGKAAHGTLLSLEEDYAVFVRAIEAIECLNILLILQDMPFGELHHSLVRRHPLVLQYSRCTIPGPPLAFKAALAQRK